MARSPGSSEHLWREQAHSARGPTLGRVLMDEEKVAPTELLEALTESTLLKVPLEQVITARSIVDPDDLLQARAAHFGVTSLRRAETPPDPDLSNLLPAAFCLKHGVLPWTRQDGLVLLATAHPHRFATLRSLLPDGFPTVSMVLASEADIQAEIAFRHGNQLAHEAETLRRPEHSCRDMNHATPRRKRAFALAAGLALTLLALMPIAFFAAAAALALCSLVLSQLLKVAALIASKGTAMQNVSVTLPQSPPRVSILVPLFHETEIARTLVARLKRLTYPVPCLEVLLVLEAEDHQTRDTISRTTLPAWFKVIEVPPGSITTKPRALNYAFGFTSGAVIGIYDAEDAPAPDQLERVVAHFEKSPRCVACVQGILDFYNPKANWLSRCFTLEYASWFRILLPGLARLGMAVPLGGTTVFFRREALERAGGWDAHNVTEDADLGIRLARLGYTTDLLATVTREEANNRGWPWVKQRSRWLKGYAITWWVHMRRPRTLWRDLGPKRFFGLQLMFLSTLLQFALAPVLWSFWLVLLGLPHPLDPYLSDIGRRIVIGTFLSAEATSVLIGLAAAARSPHPSLMPWVPTLFLYFPLGTLAFYKALWETVQNPFYWDKTQHGHSAPDTQDKVKPPP